MITIKLLGGAKKSFNSELLSVDLDSITVGNLLDYLVSIKPKDTLDLDTKNMLVAVNGIDSSALQSLDTVLHADDVVSIIPIIHGGEESSWFQIDSKSIGVFCVAHKKGQNYVLLDIIRKKFPALIIGGISLKCVLGLVHVKKIVSLSLFAQKHGVMLSKKLQTDILLRFAGTRQISEAIKVAGIESDDCFVMIVIGDRLAQKKMRIFIKQYEVKQPDFSKSSAHLKKQFKILPSHLAATWSKTPLEDLLVERSAVLFK